MVLNLPHRGHGVAAAVGLLLLAVGLSLLVYKVPAVGAVPPLAAPAERVAELGAERATKRHPPVALLPVACSASSSSRHQEVALQNITKVYNTSSVRTKAEA